MFLFVVFALIAIVAAVGVVTSRKPVYSALFLLLNFATLAALYVMVQAQFLAAVQIIVYAGAIVVLFLFVVMLIGGGELSDIRYRSRSFVGRFGWARWAALALAVALLAAVAYGLVGGQLMTAQGDPATFGQGSVQAIASVLYTDYILPFELASVLLLVGMIGAVVLARPPE
jgi:NADH-quinone oxidoreductase subunit J